MTANWWQPIHYSRWITLWSPVSSGRELGVAWGIIQRFTQPCIAWTYLTLPYLTLPYPNLFIYQTRESSLVPAGFLTAQFLQKLWFMKPLLWWEIRVGLQNYEGWTCLDILFPPYKRCREALLKFPPYNKWFINLQFLQKLGCQKPCWDQARLVNKQVDLTLPL